jgi:prolyl-tRNA synthetase
MSEKEGITVKKSENFSDWYTQVVQKADLADYAPVQGCMVIKPNGYAIWENIMRIMDQEFKKQGVKNAYFPQFIPESFLKKEAEHFKGFVPECAWVTIGGGKELGERLAIRPTSETIIYSMFSKWIRSWRDLPLKINQWCNIVRWESSTKFFVRTTEFLWQEGHTAHETMEGADKMMMDILKLYRDFIEDYLAIPLLTGKKSEKEKFAGALTTTTLEALMPDGRAIQMGTSHNLGQNFSKVFDIKFLSKNEKEKFVWTTSWGVSTRMIGSLIMAHGDDKGLILPPKIAHTHVVIVPIYYKETDKKKVLKKAEEMKQKLEKEFLKVILDDRTEYTPGWKFNEWELKGVPLRMEIGPKDVQKKQVVIVRRDNFEKVFVKDKDVIKKIVKFLDEIQKNLYNKAKKFLNEHITTVKTFDEFKKTLENKGGFLRASHCLEEGCEEKIKEETGATIRLIPFKKEKIFSNCIYCGKKAKEVVYFAKAY